MINYLAIVYAKALASRRPLGLSLLMYQAALSLISGLFHSQNG